MVEFLKTLVRLESPSDVANAQAPVLDVLQRAFQDLDYHTIRIPVRQFGGHLYARPPRPEPRRKPRSWQLLIGHCDTVWPLGTLDRMPISENGNILRGPGVYDMKAGLVEIVFALKAIRDLNLTPEVGPVVFINSDEEVGSRESSRYLKALARRADRALVLEPSLGPSGKLKTARKGVGKFTISISGVAAHAGLDPTSGASAILELSHVIQKLFALNDPERGASVNVGVIDGGLRPNVIAAESSAVVDVRVANREDGQRIERAILSLEAETPDVTIAVHGGIGRPPMERTPANRRLWHLARDIAPLVGFSVEEGTAGGGSDGNTTSQYTATLDGLGAVGDGAHAEHEFVHVSRLTERTALLAMLLLAPPLSPPAAEHALGRNGPRAESHP